MLSQISLFDLLSAAVIGFEVLDENNHTSEYAELAETCKRMLTALE